MSLRRNIAVAAVVTILVGFGASSAAFRRSTPSISLNRSSFDTCDDDWRITVTGASPNTTVYLTEWYSPISGPSDAQWFFTWNGSIGTTNGSGYLQVTFGAPSFVADFIGRVTVDGEWSNLVAYFTSSCHEPQVVTDNTGRERGPVGRR